MAVQPDKRSYERQLIESGMNLTERYRVGAYTLRAPARITNPRTYVIACDRPGLEGGLSVDYDLHDGWTVSDGGAWFMSRVGALVCLEWFVSRQKL